LNLVGILFPHINGDARSNSHSIYEDFVLVWPDDGPLRPKHVAYYLIYL